VSGRLEGKAAIVTGAARGIGKALAAGLAREGAGVVVADVLGPQAEEAAAEIRRSGGDAIAVAMDVTEYASVLAAVAAAVERWSRVDILINNAGLIAGIPRGSFEEITEQGWDRMFAVNVKGIWNCCRAAVPHMRTAGGGSIVNISSDVVISGVPGLLHYSASKGAVIGLTRALAKELGPEGIRVNSMAPGFTETPAALEHGAEAAERSVRSRPLGRAEVPEDLVGSVVFLASDDAAFMTGQLLVVNGGYVLH
jgi:3-oxoacyl-[acyl-carrier protein] reductase